MMQLNGKQTEPLYSSWWSIFFHSYLKSYIDWPVKILVRASASSSTCVVLVIVYDIFRLLIIVWRINMCFFSIQFISIQLVFVQFSSILKWISSKHVRSSYVPHTIQYNRYAFKNYARTTCFNSIVCANAKCLHFACYSNAKRKKN